jgi:phage tail sheath protein FI
MPVTPTYPGVYIEEIPSGVRTITGVATSITAFIGFAFTGATNDPIRIQSFGDFERQFGGLKLESSMSYAVQQFFLQGGTDAIIVRLANVGVKAKTELKAGGNEKLILEADAAGEDGNKLTVTVANNGDNNFDLTIVKPAAGEVAEVRESFPNLALDQVVEKLEADSKLVKVKPGTTLPSVRPNEVANQAFEGGKAKGIAAQLRLPVTSKNAAGETVNEALVLSAISEGFWGNNLQAIVDHNTADPKTLFNLTVQYVEVNPRTGERQTTSEKIRNLSMEPTATRYVADVLKTESTFVRAVGTVPKTLPDVTADPENNPIKVQDADKGSNGVAIDELLPESLDAIVIGNQDDQTGLYALEKADLFNLLCIPPITRGTDVGVDTVLATALKYCVDRRAMLIIDPPSSWTNPARAEAGVDTLRQSLGARFSTNAAVFFPRLKMADPLLENRTQEFAPCGAIAGIFARTDAERGVWKAPAGIDASVSGVRELTYKLTDRENGRLNPKGLNCVRVFPVYGNVVWGARTLAGDDRLTSEWKYVPVRRMALFLEESLYRGTQWVVFEPNDEPLWAQIRLNIGAFMQNLFRQGAFQGKTPREAYFVKCDKETTTQNDINLGIVNIIIGFAPLKPAEFVILKFQQMAGQIET